MALEYMNLLGWTTAREDDYIGLIINWRDDYIGLIINWQDDYMNLLGWTIARQLHPSRFESSKLQLGSPASPPRPVNKLGQRTEIGIELEMEDARRYRPIQNSNICPTCSRPHFPFCPHPPPFHRFPPPPPPSFLHPRADHYPMPVVGPGPYPHPHPRPIANPISGDALAAPPPYFSHPWNENQMLARRGGFFPEDLDERAHKRTRIGDAAAHSFPPSDFASAERERQLNLIREHGSQSLSRQDANLGSYNGFEYDMHGQGQKFEEQRVAGGDLQIRSRFDPSGLDSVARARPFWPPEQEAMNRQNDQFLSFPRAENFHSETQKENSAGTLYNNSQDSQYPHGHHSHSETPSYPPDGIGPRNASMGAGNYADPVWRNQDVVADHGRERQNMNWAEQGDRNQVEGSAQTSHENFQAFGHHLPTKEYSWQGMNAEHKGQGYHGRMEKLLPNILPPQSSHTMRSPVGNMAQFHGQHSDVKPFEPRTSSGADQNSGHSPMTACSNTNYGGTSLGASHPPASLPHCTFPKDLLLHYPSHHHSPSSPRKSPPICPIPTSSAVGDVPGPPRMPHFPEFQPSAHSHLHNKLAAHACNGFPAEGPQFVHHTLSNQFVGEGHAFQPKPSQQEKPKVINAAQLFRRPHRATRPDHIVVILRGLPGSGKSYLAKILRDLEVENGGNAPRIHSMDDYFMTEIEKVEEVDSTKSSSLGKGKKRITKKVMEYCYEPEMEEVMLAYRSSIGGLQCYALPSFSLTADAVLFGIDPFVAVDDRNLRVADFAQFWATAKVYPHYLFSNLQITLSPNQETLQYLDAQMFPMDIGTQ
ncbi:hypothetical protein ACLOJK_006086 [Asimina triloba]